MSLKAFHIFFIAMSILITLGFAAWVWMGGPSREASGGSLGIMAMGSAVLGLGLIVYGVYFIRKSRHIII